MKKMQIDKFVDIVERMRQAQNEWFRTHNKNAFQRALILEKIVDKDIKDWHEENDPHRPRQLDLFAEVNEDPSCF